jgi:hypothetical protein
MNQSKVQARSRAIVIDGLGTGLLEGVVYGAGLTGAALLGAWSLSCLGGGALVAGGPMGLIGGWFHAVIGL